MSHRIRQKRIPLGALGEPKTKGSGTARVVAESNHGGLLNPNCCWDSVQRKCVGQPTGTFGISRHSCTRGTTSAHGTCRSKLLQ